MSLPSLGLYTVTIGQSWLDAFYVCGCKSYHTTCDEEMFGVRPTRDGFTGLEVGVLTPTDKPTVKLCDTHAALVFEEHYAS